MHALRDVAFARQGVVSGVDFDGIEMLRTLPEGGCRHEQRPEMNSATLPTAHCTGALHASPAAATRQDGMAAWLVVTAPGMLLTRSVAILMLVAAAGVRAFEVDPLRVTAAGAGYLAAHAVATLWMVRRPGRGSIVLALALLVVDAALAGGLLSSGAAWRGPAIAVAVLAIGIGFEATAWRGVLLSGCVIVVVLGLMAWSGRLQSPPPARPFSPALSIERSFVGARISSRAAATFAVLLSVETHFAGAPVRAATDHLSPVLSVERSFGGVALERRTIRAPSVFIPAALLAAAVALIIGNIANLARSRRTRAAVANAVVAVGRPAL